MLILFNQSYMIDNVLIDVFLYKYHGGKRFSLAKASSDTDGVISPQLPQNIETSLAFSPVARSSFLSLPPPLPAPLSLLSLSHGLSKKEMGKPLYHRCGQFVSSWS